MKLPFIRSLASAGVFTIHGFDYHASYTFTTPAHQNSWGYVNFNLTNSLTPYSFKCSASSGQLQDFFYGTVAYACTPDDTAPVGAGANFKYSRPSGQLDVEQTIPGQGNSTVMSGTVQVTVTCTDNTTTNEHWTMGQIYSQRSVVCAQADFTVPAN
ncbi:hypothetical protein QBC47DRAFT_30963 [Echria macrotheca]|uniref:AA1-like domain-containing protein n=1 Tax=Echria macrotheca TaxID=438768 RepID=A0AAJ0FGX6_9PEZI|nr:hypothetical protein QBC47DRAFT_30963 [Echria macrotheca]